MLTFLSILAIIAGFSVNSRLYQFGSQADVTEPNLKVMSYNVRIFNFYKWDNNTTSRDSILLFIESQKADVICLQEFLTLSNIPNKSQEHINRKLANTPYRHVSYTHEINNGRKQFGIATYSKYPIINSGIIRFPNSINACNYSDIVREQDTFRVYNAHLQSIKLPKDNYGLIDSLLTIKGKNMDEVKAVSGKLRDAFKKRATQAEMIAKHISSSPYPVILCGDFNDTPVSYTYHKLRGNLTDSFQEGGKGLASTYRGQLPSFRIDYIFHDSRFKTQRFTTKRVDLSDHYPIISEIGL